MLDESCWIAPSDMAAIKPQPHVANLAFVHPAKRHFESRTTSGQERSLLGTRFIHGWFEKFRPDIREDNEGIDVIDDPLENISMER